jgi:hypothetical protein
MTRRLPAVLILAVTGSLPLLLLGCPKKPPPPVEVVDAAPAAPVDSGPTILTPLDDDSGPDAAEAAAPKKAYHPPANTNAAAIKQCCAALRTEAKALGASPESGVLITLAGQCDQFAVAATSGNAPEFAAIRQMLSRGTMPAACQGIK